MVDTASDNVDKVFGAGFWAEKKLKVESKFTQLSAFNLLVVLP